MFKKSSAPLSGEDAVIAAVDRTLRSQVLPSGWVGIGDDASVTSVTNGMQTLTTTDLLVEGVHFRRETISPWELGWKAIAVNASDIAGMGGVVRWATVSLAMPPGVSLEWVKAFYEGCATLAQSLGLAIVGGDTVGSPGPLMVAVTVVGETEKPILRKGAQVGDRVLVTRTIGDAAAGFWCLEHPLDAMRLSEATRLAVVRAHSRPVPSMEEGRAIGALAARIAMMDNSDGLARSVLWMGKANQLRIVLAAESLPLSEAMREVAAIAGVDPLHWALYGGEDYNLVLTCPSDAVEELKARLAAVGSRASVLGRCMAGEPGAFLNNGGIVTALDLGRTFQHLEL